MNEDTTPASPGRGRFATTHWSVVQAATQPKTLQCQQALETLCQTYWFPVYAYLRRWGHSQDAAEDYTQGFFAHLLERDGFRLADRERGRFRSFLLSTLKHFVSNEQDKQRALKRGGGRTILSLDLAEAEGRYAVQSGQTASPERAFERSWALTILASAMTRLQGELAHRGKGDLFDHLKGYMTADQNTVPYEATARALGMTENAVKVAVHRLRRRYRELLKDEIAQTVSDEQQIDDEIGRLFAALAQ
jgi:RNA polymerase sigma factor (sigma-70 family)